MKKTICSIAAAVGLMSMGALAQNSPQPPPPDNNATQPSGTDSKSSVAATPSDIAAPPDVAPSHDTKSTPNTDAKNAQGGNDTPDKAKADDSAKSNSTNTPR